MKHNENKSFRLLKISDRLNKGEYLNKTNLANEYDVNEKTIQRDIDDLRAYFAETYTFEKEVAIKYSKSKNAYYLVRLEREWMSAKEVMAISKILLESRAFNKEELEQILTKFIMQVEPNDKKQVEELIRNEKFNYIPLIHGKNLLDIIWDLSSFISKTQIISFNYTRQDGIVKKQKVKPVAIMFSEYYFYLVAYFADNSQDLPTIFRIDRISDYKTNGETFYVPYKDKFSDGEFRKRIQFMYTGELQTIKFEFSGPSLEAILDRIPTAKIIAQNEKTYTLKAETYGQGVKMWLRSQGDWVKILN